MKLIYLLAFTIALTISTRAQSLRDLQKKYQHSVISLNYSTILTINQVLKPSKIPQQAIVLTSLSKGTKQEIEDALKALKDFILKNLGTSKDDALVFLNFNLSDTSLLYKKANDFTLTASKVPMTGKQVLEAIFFVDKYNDMAVITMEKIKTASTTSSRGLEGIKETLADIQAVDADPFSSENLLLKYKSTFAESVRSNKDLFAEFKDSDKVTFEQTEKMFTEVDLRSVWLPEEGFFVYEKKINTLLEAVYKGNDVSVKSKLKVYLENEIALEKIEAAQQQIEKSIAGKGVILQSEGEFQNDM
jgi:hypothetical protein